MKKTDNTDISIKTVGETEKFGAAFPNGTVQLYPDYAKDENTVEGFSFNHKSDIGCYSNLQLMPIVNETDLRSTGNHQKPLKNGTFGWKSPYNRQSEIINTGYHAVFLDRYDTYVEATATKHCGMLRISYPKDSKNGLIFNFSKATAGKVDFQHVEIINESLIEGYINCTKKCESLGKANENISYKLYFIFELSHPMKSYKFFSNEKYIEDNIKIFEGEDVGLIARFEEKNDNPIMIKCGISYTDSEQARKSLLAECRDFDFEKIKEKTKSAWEEEFSIQ